MQEKIADMKQHEKVLAKVKIEDIIVKKEEDSEESGKKCNPKVKRSSPERRRGPVETAASPAKEAVEGAGADLAAGVGLDRPGERGVPFGGAKRDPRAVGRVAGPARAAAGDE